MGEIGAKGEGEKERKMAEMIKVKAELIYYSLFGD